MASFNEAPSYSKHIPASDNCQNNNDNNNNNKNNNNENKNNNISSALSSSSILCKEDEVIHKIPVTQSLWLQ